LIQTHAAQFHPGGDRGVSQAGFVVLNTARRPAVLVETGFSTNPTDGRFLSSSAGQQRLAQSLADAVVAYFQQYENKVASGPSREPSRGLFAPAAGSDRRGCAYYNGLYNANRLADDAQRAIRQGRPGEAKARWQEAAIKAESVAIHFPHSRYREEALLLQGRALLKLGNASAPACRSR